MQYARSLGVLGIVSLLCAQPMAASANETPLELTILRTVNLPWQEPEVILTAQADVDTLVVTVTVDGVSEQARTFPALATGASRSITWPAQAGSHACEVRVRGQHAGRAFEVEELARVEVVAPLELTLAPRDVDLAKGKLRFHANTAVSFSELSLHDLDGNVLHQATKRFEAHAGKQAGKRAATHAGTHAYQLDWPKLSRSVARVSLRVFSTSDTWADVEWSPLEIEVPHEPIYFDDALVAGPSLERLAGAYAVLQLTLSEHEALHGLRLYVLGTGVADADAEEAKQQARAVAAYFRERGLSLPTFVGGTVDPNAPSSQGEVQAILALEAPAVAAWTPLSQARIKRAR